ncbi:aliphatic sulfonate ABC transporter substrate-binding protein [Tumidithrix elongata RA019]|uniref:Putative aliphatic sulfonates-binding protein n=1 Tax=Tumidithrix elongata BACA0141 TaxID=2716417 RepID=A0AAW9PT13_9CYAN|nr:aliphatic sulfonate ABC transporter substrate-binding protein [Tumidithrix elongata RA019]
MNLYNRRSITKAMGYFLLAIASGCTATNSASVTTSSPASTATTATNAPAKSQNTAKAKVIRIGVSKFGAMLNALREKGTLEKSLSALGVSLEWKEFIAGPQLMEALAVGTIDLTYTGEPPPIFAQANGTPVVYLANEKLGVASVAVLVPKDSDIKGVADLKGKRVAISKATNSQYIVIRALETVGLTFNDITPVYLTPSDGRIAFEGGKVDAWSTWDPFQAAAEQALGAKILFDGKGFLPNTGYYLSTKSFADNNAETIAVILKQVEEINDWAAKNPRAVAELLSPKYGVSVEVLEIVEKRREHGFQPIDEKVIAEQQRIADVFLKEKVLPKPVIVKEAIWKPKS